MPRYDAYAHRQFQGTIAATGGGPGRADLPLREHNFADLQGRLELSHAPDLPLDRREVLALRIGTIEFSSSQIIAWAIT